MDRFVEAEKTVTRTGVIQGTDIKVMADLLLTILYCIINILLKSLTSCCSESYCFGRSTKGIREVKKWIEA